MFLGSREAAYFVLAESFYLKVMIYVRGQRFIFFQ